MMTMLLIIMILMMMMMVMIMILIIMILMMMMMVMIMILMMMMMVNSARALLGELQPEHTKPSLAAGLRKKREVSEDPEYKRYSGFTVESSPSLTVDITEEMYEVMSGLSVITALKL